MEAGVGHREEGVDQLSPGYNGSISNRYKWLRASKEQTAIR
jgi:hypothetical protein